MPLAQRMKNSFVFTLWSWASIEVNVQIVDVIDFFRFFDYYIVINNYWQFLNLDGKLNF